MIGDSSVEMSVGDGSVCNMSAIRVESAEVGDKVYGNSVGTGEWESGDNPCLPKSMTRRNGSCNMGMMEEAARSWCPRLLSIANIRDRVNAAARL